MAVDGISKSPRLIRSTRSPLVLAISCAVVVNICSTSAMWPPAALTEGWMLQRGPSLRLGDPSRQQRSSPGARSAAIGARPARLSALCAPCGRGALSTAVLTRQVGVSAFPWLRFRGWHHPTLNPSTTTAITTLCKLDVCVANCASSAAAEWLLRHWPQACCRHCPLRDRWSVRARCHWDRCPWARDLCLL